MSTVSVNTQISDSVEPDLATIAIRSGHNRTGEMEHSEPIFATSSFVFDSAEHAAAMFAETSAGNIYSRFTNPTVSAFESRLGAMERANYCIGTSSGMSAISAVTLGLLKAGDHVVACREMFGSTISLFTKIFQPFGISVTLVPVHEVAAWQNAITPKTKMMFVESPSNPLGRVANIVALSNLAKQHSALLVVDNCFCTPALQRPLSLGADIVVHSATKYLDGQGRCVGGAIAITDTNLHDKLFAVLRAMGPSMSPFNAWIFLKGLETLDLRMEKHCHNARKLAEWLYSDSRVEKVFYAGIPDHPDHGLAKRQQNGFGGVVSFQVPGGREAAWRVIDATKMASITANLGDVKTTITHPATTTHARIAQEQRDEAGVTENLIRVSVGIEGIDDIIGDINRGLSSLSVTDDFRTD